VIENRAGYGHIYRASLSPPSVPSTSASPSAPRVSDVIIKSVNPPRGESGVGHARKLRSYENERHFYEKYAPRLRAAGLSVPHPLHLEGSPSGPWLFVLSDLHSEGFTVDPGDLSLKQAGVAVDFLAAFHACFWGEGENALPSSTPFPASSSSPSPSSPRLWSEGCYWHLETRQEELSRIGGEWRPLRDLGPALDRALRAAPHRTVVHGDAKCENLLFNAAGAHVQ
jgi:hypothetical protein